VLPLGRKFPFLRKFQPSEGIRRKSNLEGKRRKYEYNARSIKKIRNFGKFATKRRKI